MAGPFEGLKYVPDQPEATPALAASPAAPAASPYAGLKYTEDVQAAPAPPPSTATAVGRGALQGASLGWGDEIAAAADTLISKIPGVRSAAEYLAPAAGGRGGSLSYTDPNVTYQQRRDAYRATNAAAKEAHPYAYGGGEVAGGIATAFAPGMTLAKGAGALKVGAQGAALGGAAAAGESEAKDVRGVLKDTAEGAAIGGVGGAVLHKAAGKAAKILAKGLPELADRQAAEALTRKVGKAGAPESLTRPVMNDPNLSAVINEPIQVGKKSVTLAQVAGKPAEESRAFLQAGQQKVDDALTGHFHTADAATGGAPLADLANHYDAEIAARAKTPGNEHHIRALEGARQDALASWGPSAEAIEQRKGEIGRDIGKVYERADEAAGGVRVGDLVQHYDDQIAKLAKTPGNEATIKALEETKNSVVNAWGKGKVFNADMVLDGPEFRDFKGAKAGDAVAKLEQMAKARPALASDLNAAAQRIRDAATSEGLNPDALVPAKDVRAYATTLQDRGASTVENPSVAAQARQFLGSTTRDFVNGHVEKTLSKADRKALEGLNGRMSNLYRWDDVAAERSHDPAVRNAVLKEFDTRVPAHAVDQFASQLEERGTQRIDKLNPGPAAQAKENLGKSTREFLGKHMASAAPEEAADYQRLLSRRQSLRNIDKVLADRIPREAANKAGGGGTLLKAGGHLLAGNELIHAVPKALSGDFVGAGADVGKAVLAAGLPHAITQAGAAKRALVRGAARGTDYLARAVAQADAGNPAAQRILALLRSTPAGAARIAAAVARMKGAATPAPPAEP